MSTNQQHNRGQTGAKRRLELQEDIAWTAARCNRLLRTISSRINTLRKLIRTENKNVHVRKQTTAAEHWSTADPVWLPNGRKKLRGRTYAAKKKTASQTTKPEEKPMCLAFPSPFVRRMGADQHPVTGESPLCTRRENVPKTRRSRQLPVIPSSEVQELEEGLATALMNLLSQTEAMIQPRRTGARTLLSACLRKVPSYVELEIEATGKQGEAETITSDVLSYLEDMGSKSGGGWPALAEVIRSHGVHLICCAIDERLIGDRAADRLAGICSARGANAEAQQIFGAFLSNAEMSAMDVASSLDYFCMMDQSQEFKYKTLCNMGERDAEIMIRAFGIPGFCNALLSRLAVSATTTAWTFVSNVASAFQNLEHSDSSMSRYSSSFKSIMVRIAAMACAGSLLGKADARGLALFEALNRLTAATIIASSDGGLRSRSSESALLILCSEFLLSLEDCSREPDAVLNVASLSILMNDWTGRAARQAQWRAWRHDFVSELADAVVALETRLELGLVNRLLGRVLDVSRSRSPGANLLQELSLAIISGIGQADSRAAENSPEDFLRQMESITAEGAPPTTPYRKVQDNKFRWEDGLSEWVLATPFVTKTLHCGDDGANSSLEKSVCSEPVFDSGYYSPQVVVAYSPDVLAPSSPAERVRRPVYSPVARERKRSRPRGGPQANEFKIRKSRRISDKENEGSGDELGF